MAYGGLGCHGRGCYGGGRPGCCCCGGLRVVRLLCQVAWLIFSIADQSYLAQLSKWSTFVHRIEHEELNSTPITWHGPNPHAL